MAQKNTLRIRFVLNRESGAKRVDKLRARKGTDKFAQVVIEDVGTKYAAGKFHRLKATIQGKLEPMIRSELRHVVAMYKDFIVGNQRQGRGTLTTNVRGTGTDKFGNLVPARSVSLATALPKWTARKPKYLADKRRQMLKLGLGGDAKEWFKFTGYLRSEMNVSNWEAMFGPITVSVKPTERKSLQKEFAFNSAYGDKVFRFGVAKISVGVFGMVTPQMVAALADGDMSGSRLTGDGRNNGLMGLVAAKNPELADRLSGKRAFVPYRPNMEAFIAFAVTRSLPAALFNRLSAEGFSPGSAGRTR